MMVLLSGLDETSAILEDDTRFLAACVKLVNVLKSFYFLERCLILDGVHPQKKGEIHRYFFGSLYDTVYEAYYEATGRAVVHTQFGIKTTFRAKNDERYSKEDYCQLSASCRSIGNYTQDIYRTLVARLDNVGAWWAL